MVCVGVQADRGSWGLREERRATLIEGGTMRRLFLIAATWLAVAGCQEDSVAKGPCHLQNPYTCTTGQLCAFVTQAPATDPEPGDTPRCYKECAHDPDTGLSCPQGGVCTLLSNSWGDGICLPPVACGWQTCVESSQAGAWLCIENASPCDG